DLFDGVREVGIHGEVLAAPVNRGPEALHLAEDRTTIVLTPLPDALDELFASQILALASFRRELALDHHLRSNAGVVSTGKPESNLSVHAVPSRDDVHLGLVEHVPHMQASGNVGRGQEDVKDTHSPRFFRSGAGDIKEVLFDPVFGPMRLY